MNKVYESGSSPAGNRRNKTPAGLNLAVDASALHIIRIPACIKSLPKVNPKWVGESDYNALYCIDLCFT